jgi:hypothetical protein
MTINELLKDTKEQENLSEILRKIIENLKFIKPKTQRSKESNSNIEGSNDSFLGKNSIPVISRLKGNNNI